VASALVIAADFLSLACYVAAVWAAGAHEPRGFGYLAIAAPMAAVVQVSFAYLHMYDFKELTRPAGYLPRIAVGSAAALPFAYASRLFFLPSQSPGWCYALFVLLIAALYSERRITHAVLLSLVERGTIARNAVIIGSGPLCHRVLCALGGPQRPWTRILGIFADRTGPAPAIADCPWLGTTDEAVEFARIARADDVVLVLPRMADANLRATLDMLRVLPVNVHLVLDADVHSLSHNPSAGSGRIRLVRFASKPLDGWRAIVKSVEDKTVAALALLLLMPVIALVAFAVRLDSPGPIFFWQHRLQQPADRRLQVPHHVRRPAGRRCREARHTRRSAGHAGRSVPALHWPR
jgi:hypothetical protein